MRVARILGVTAFLGALGGLAGALGGVLIALGLVAAVDVLPDLSTLRGVFSAATAVGFSVGVIAGPILAWTLLRHTPIWRAIGETALAAGLGASLSLALAAGFWPMLGWSVGGATIAALRLRFASHRTHVAAAVPLPNEEL